MTHLKFNGNDARWWDYVVPEVRGGLDVGHYEITFLFRYRVTLYVGCKPGWWGFWFNEWGTCNSWGMWWNTEGYKLEFDDR